jgi:signal transduction histidine kinase
VASERAADGTIIVVVEDDGPGVPESLREKVLMPFFTTKAVGVGTGLGLAVVQKIAAEHGGRLAVTRSTARTRRRTLRASRTSAIKRHKRGKRGKRNLMRSVGSERSSRSDDATGASFRRVATIARA